MIGGYVICSFRMLAILLAFIYVFLSYKRRKTPVKQIFSGVDENQAKKVLIVLMTLGLLLRVITIDKITFSDESLYINVAKEVYNGSVMYKDFFFFHPPFYPYLTAIVFKLLGVGVAQAKITPLVLSALTIPLIYAISRRWYGLKPALFSAMVYAISAGTVIMTRIATMYSEMLFFSLLGVYFFLNGFYENNRFHILLAGISFGVSSMFRLFGLLVPAVILIFLIWKRQHLEHLIILGVGGMIVASPFALYFNDTDFVYQILGHHYAKPDIGLFMKIMTFSRAMILYALSTTIGLLSAGVMIRDKKMRDVDVFFVLWIVLGALGVFSVRYWHNIAAITYYIIIAPPLILLGGRAVELVDPYWLKTLVVAILLVELVEYNSIDFISNSEWDRGIRETARYVEMNSDANDKIIGERTVFNGVSFLSGREVAGKEFVLNYERFGIGELNESYMAQLINESKFVVTYPPELVLPVMQHSIDKCETSANISGFMVYDCRGRI